MAEAEGEVSIWVENEHACTVIRRKCYAYRSQLRKGNMGLTGMEVSAYDSYTFPYTQDHSNGRWKFTITANEEIEFELIVPEEPAKPIPHFDWLEDSDIPVGPLDEHEDLVQQAADAYMDEVPF